MASSIVVTVDDDEERITSSARNGSGNTVTVVQPEEQGTVKCPRCDSSNTKFCYYNNYSLSQPRHFCKTCKRYWTKGGALRNVPVGGGSRKNKKTKPSSSSTGKLSLDSSMSFSYDHPLQYIPRPQSSVLPLFNGLGSFSSSPFFTNNTNNNMSDAATLLPFDDLSITTTPSKPNSIYSHTITPLVPHATPTAPSSSSFTGMKSHAIDNHREGLASSIESLSSINQLLHLKLQQQRLAMFMGSDQDNEIAHNDTAGASGTFLSHTIQQQPVVAPPFHIAAPENLTPNHGDLGLSYAGVCGVDDMVGGPDSMNNGGGHEGNWSALDGIPTWNFDLHDQFSV